MVDSMNKKRKRVKLKPEEFVSQHDKIEEGVVHTRLRNKDGRWFDMFDYVPEGIGVDRLTNEGTKTTKKEEKIFTINDLNKMLVDGNKVKQQKIDLMKESEVSDEAYNLMPRKEFINAQNRAAEKSSQPTPQPKIDTALDPDDVTYNPFDSEEIENRIENDFDNFVAESKARSKNMRRIKLAFPEATPEEQKEMFLQKRARKMKTQHDQKEYDRLEKEGKLNELPKSNAFHPEYINPHADKEKKEETPQPEQPSGDVQDTGANPSGLQIAMRPKLAVNIMRIQFPEDVISEINEHIDNTIIPANKDYSKGLVGQISHDKRSAQLHFPHNDDGVGKQFSDVITRMGSEYIDRVVGIRSEI